MKRFYILYYFSGNKELDVPSCVHDTYMGVPDYISVDNRITSAKEVAIYDIANRYNIDEENIKASEIGIVNMIETGEWK